MKRPILILFAGIAVAVAAYCGVYYGGTAKCCRMQQGQAPELLWLKQEFHLSDTEFKRISELHQAYLSGCAQRCHLIDQKNQQVAHLLAASDHVTPEIDKALKDAALLRADCQQKMLEHFYEVSRTMPPEQGKRYLAWVQQQTIPADSHSQMHH
jgi:Heavy-metal resistance